MFPKLISIGSLFLPTYGVLVALGFLAGLWFTNRLAKPRGLDPEKITNLVVACALAGILGAKIAMLIFDWNSYYSKNPGEIFSIATLQAAGVYQGGLVLAMIVAWWMMRRDKLPFLETADLFAPGLALGHAIGRLGCFAAGCCWGSECSRPWAVVFRNNEAHELTGVPLGVPLHPSQLYESFANLLLFFFLWKMFERPHPRGRVIGLYLVSYSIIRFIIEFFRFHAQDLPFGLQFSLTQWIAAGLFLLGAYFLRPQRNPVTIG